MFCINWRILQVDKTLPLRARALTSTMLVLICIPFLDPFTLAASPVCEACQFYLDLLHKHRWLPPGSDSACAGGDQLGKMEASGAADTKTVSAETQVRRTNMTRHSAYRTMTQVALPVRLSNTPWEASDKAQNPKCCEILCKQWALPSDLHKYQFDSVCVLAENLQISHLLSKTTSAGSAGAAPGFHRKTTGGGSSRSSPPTRCRCSRCPRAAGWANLEVFQVSSNRLGVWTFCTKQQAAIAWPKAWLAFCRRLRYFECLRSAPADSDKAQKKAPETPGQETQY